MNSLSHRQVFGCIVAVVAFASGLISVATYRAVTGPRAYFAAAEEIPKAPPIPFEEPRSNVEIAEPFVVEIEEVKETGDAGFSGWYEFDGPGGLRDVDTISIGNYFESGKNGEDTWRTSAFLFTRFLEIGDQGTIGHNWIRTEGDRISFRTDKIKGFEFQFKGEFFKGRKMGKEGEVLLRGTLTQYRGKKKIASATGNFRYHEPQCWH